MRRCALLFAVLVSALPAPARAERASCVPRDTAGLGLACRHPNGLYELFAPDGRSLGFTHGGDPAPPATAADGAPPAPGLRCAESDDPYFARVIYAYARDGQNRYASVAPDIRFGVAAAGALLANSAAATGAAGAAIEVACSGGQVAVDAARLGTSASRATPTTIMSDLQALGYTDGKQKLWVLYDDAAACACAGIANIYFDDRPTADNANNGNRAVMTAINFAQPSSGRVWMHELAHTIGAVQISAPHTTNAGHCTDGRDTLCYNDGGSRGGSYSTSHCSTEVFDCGNDDYFSAAPASGSYLATHWNLGGPANRYVDLYHGAGATLVDPRPGVVYQGCGTASPGLPLATAVYAERGCVRVGLAGTEQKLSLYFDNTLVSSVDVAGRTTVAFDFPIPTVGYRYAPVDVLVHHADGTTGRVNVMVDTAGI